MLSPPSRRRVLIADDDHVTFALLKSLLSKWGYQVVAACDGHEAMAVLQRENAPPMAILDWMMPGITGTDIIKSIRQAGRPYIYSLLLTSRDSQDDMLEGLSAGADDYLVKPIQSKELRARLLVGERILKLQEALLAAYQKAQFQAQHDGLTGLQNRLAILQVLRRELQRGMREGNTVGVIMADIDHFKLINDTHGHSAGDGALLAAASAMHKCLRPYDSFSRYGGEEFLAVVPNCQIATLVEVAERMRRSVQELTFDAGTTGVLRLSCSFGVAITADPLQDEAALINAADLALYRAKSQGRNRVESATSGPSLAPDLAAVAVRRTG